MGDRLIVMLICALVALLFFALGLPLVRRSVPPNWLYGFRLPQTVNDPELWYPANEYAGRWLIALGALLLVLAVAGYFTPLATDTYAIVVVSIEGAGTIAMVIACLMWLWRRTGVRSGPRSRDRTG